LSAAALWPIGGAFLGALIGSFLALLTVRLPQDRGVVRGRSCCDRCGVVLGAIDLIPLVSFAVRRGRCRACGGAIDPVHWQIEAAAMLIGGAAFALWTPAQAAAFALLGWLLLPLAWIDARHYWLPDPLVMALALGGLALGGQVSGASMVDRLAGAIGGGLSLALVAWLYRVARGREGLGGGDPKLFAALGCWLGWALLPPLLLIASALGLGWAAMLHARGTPLSATARLPLGTLLAAAVPLALLVPIG
jgi:leader peptidase (prepilin peptidase)/N-methyltransferase